MYKLLSRFYAVSVLQVRQWQGRLFSSGSGLGAMETSYNALINEEKTETNGPEREELDNDVGTVIERMITYRNAMLEYLEQDDTASFERRCGPLNALIKRTRAKLEGWKVLAGETPTVEPTKNKKKKGKKC